MNDVVESTLEEKIAREREHFLRLLRNGQWTLAFAHKTISNPDEWNLDLYEIAGLATAILIYQSEG